jgi:hypothetical protein
MLPQHIYASNFVVITLVCPNQGKYYEIEVQFAKQDVAT